MPNEEQVAELAEKLGEVKFYRGKAPLKDISLPEEREALARVALEYCEEREYDSEKPIPPKVRIIREGETEPEDPQ